MAMAQTLTLTPTEVSRLLTATVGASAEYRREAERLRKTGEFPTWWNTNDPSTKEEATQYLNDEAKAHMDLYWRLRDLEKANAVT